MAVSIPDEQRHTRRSLAGEACGSDDPVAIEHLKMVLPFSNPSRCVLFQPQKGGR
jgi:hypothetical protein